MTNGINGINGINGTNGTNGINGCFIPPSAQGRAKSPCVGADSISARKVRVIAGASALGAPTHNHMWAVGANIVRPWQWAAAQNPAGAYGMLPYAS